MKKRGMAITVIVIAILLVLLIYGLMDPATAPFPKCPFYTFTGLKCPGCGSQRAVHQLLHLNIAQALRYNACLVAFIPIMLFLIAAQFLRGRYPRLHAAAYNPILSWTIVAVILLWFLLRNIFGW